MDKDIVLIPGALASPVFWRYQVHHFQGRARFHYVDVLNSASIVDMAKRFAEIAPNKFTLIGFSMGGYVALELLRYIPQKVEKLVLINSAAKTLSDKGQLERERSLTLISKGKFDFLISLIFKNSIYDKNKHDDLLSLLQTMAHEIGAENYIAQLNAILTKPDHTSLLSGIKCPTLLVASKQDKIMPTERSEHLENNIKNSKLVYLENCGHVAPLEQPELLNEALENWL